MSTDNQTTEENPKQMSNDKILSVEDIRGTLKKMKEGVKKQPGLMKSTYRYLDAVSGYVERIANAKEEGAWVASHGTQQPLEILEAMDVRGVFNEFWGVVSNIVNMDSVPEALSASASTGTPTEVCSFFRNMDGLMHAGKWPRSDFFLYATSCCDNVKSFHTLGRRYGIPSFGLERSYFPYTTHAMEHWKNEYKRLIAWLEEQTGRKMDYDRLKETVRLSYRLTELHIEIDPANRQILIGGLSGLMAVDFDGRRRWFYDLAPAMAAIPAAPDTPCPPAPTDCSATCAASSPTCFTPPIPTASSSAATAPTA